MRSTAIPKLSDLPANDTVIRCQYCHELVRSHEACESGKEAEACPARRLMEGPWSMSSGPMRLRLSQYPSQTAETRENSQSQSQLESQNGEEPDAA